MNNKIAKNLKEFDKIIEKYISKFRIVLKDEEKAKIDFWRKEFTHQEKKQQELVEDIIKCIDKTIEEYRNLEKTKDNEIKILNDLKDKVQEEKVKDRPPFQFDAMVEEIEKMKKIHTHDSIPSYTADKDDGCAVCIYNQTIIDVINKIQNNTIN